MFTTSTRQPFRRGERATRALVALLALVAVAGVTGAWLVQRGDDRARVAVEHQLPAALDTTAPTVAPLLVPTAITRPTESTAVQTNRRTPGAVKPKPEPKPVIAPVVPQHLYVPAIGVNTTVQPKPTEMREDPFLKKEVPSFGVPDDLYTTTWWSSGPKPGAQGMAVMLGHTQVGGGYGVFNNLAELKAGEAIGVQHGDVTLRFAVLNVRTGISKTDPNALSRVLSAHPAAARLALLTCSGDFNSGFRESAENTVVFARLVSVSR